MKPADVIGFAAVVSIGLWLLVFPESVIRFYAWFHHGRTALPRPRGVRIGGAIWLVLAAFVWWNAFLR